ncbi:MAG: hypothetical protein NXI17_23345 [Alphaproteobacteria bacterium]|nr:hypothetical protein [Alphaproteobacteria bacterium]
MHLDWNKLVFLYCAKLFVYLNVFIGITSSGFALGWHNQNAALFVGTVSALDTRNSIVLSISDGRVPHGNFGNFTARIVGLGSNESITIYSGRSGASQKIGAIPSGARNIKVKVCARHAAKTWCSVTFKGLNGYVLDRNLRRMD